MSVLPSDITNMYWLISNQNTEKYLLSKVDLTKLQWPQELFLNMYGCYIIYGKAAQVQLGLLLVTALWQKLHV